MTPERYAQLRILAMSAPASPTTDALQDVLQDLTMLRTAWAARTEAKKEVEDWVAQASAEARLVRYGDAPGWQTYEDAERLFKELAEKVLS